MKINDLEGVSRIFANGSTQNKEMGGLVWPTVDAEEALQADEPLSPDFEAVLFKLGVLEALSQQKELAPGLHAVLASDILFFDPNGNDQLKISRRADFDRDAEVTRLQTTYSSENNSNFSRAEAKWVVNFAFMEAVVGDQGLEKSTPQIMSLVIHAFFELPHPSYIDETFNPDMNTGFKLAEYLTDKKARANVILSNQFPTELAEVGGIRIEPELAVQMIRDKLLPTKLLEQLVDQKKSEQVINAESDAVVCQLIFAELDTTGLEQPTVELPRAWLPHAQTSANA